MIDQVFPKRVVQEYIDGVLAGDIVVSKPVRMAVERHVDDLKNAHVRGLKFDEERATEACDYFPGIGRHTLGEWDREPFVLSGWQAFIVWVVFGWKWIKSGHRRYRKAFIEIARKNGKSSFSAAVGNMMLFFDDPVESGAEIYCVATKEDQAQIVFKEMVRQVKASRALMKRAEVRKAPAAINYPAKNGSIRVLGSDSEGTDGLNPHLVIIDELHAWRERHRDLKEKLSSGGGARRQPLELMITTAGSNESNLWIEEETYAISVLEGAVDGRIVDDTYFAFIARIDPGDDPFDEACWPKANPNFEISVKPEYLRHQANEAKHKPTSKSIFLRYHCNRIVSSSERMICPEAWKKGNRPLSIEYGMVGYGAIDVGRTNDFFAVSSVFPFHDEQGEIDHYELMSKAWCCKDGSLNVQAEPFRSWINRGLLICHEGDSVNYKEIYSEIAELDQLYDIASWAFDESWASVIGQHLVDEMGLNVVKFPQNAKKYNPIIQQFQTDLAAGRIIHGHDELLSWQATNLLSKEDNEGRVMPGKRLRHLKVDGMVAVLMAFGESLFAQKKAKGSLYVT